MGRLVLVTPATATLLSLEQAKLHCRCQHDAENDLFLEWIKSAEAYCREYTQRALLNSTYRWIGCEFPRDNYGVDAPLDLLISPVQSITSVSYVDADGEDQELDEDEYQLEAGVIAPKLWPGVDCSWPVTQAGNVSAVTVELQAGYTSLDLVPAQFKQAMRLIIGQWYKQREEIVMGTIVATPPIAAHRLLDQVLSERYV